MHRQAGRTHPTRVTNAVTGLTDRRMSVTTVLTSGAGAPVSLGGAPLREMHASFALVTRVVRVMRAATGAEGTPSRTMAMPLGEEGTREPRGAARASDPNPVLVPAAALQRAPIAPVARPRAVVERGGDQEARVRHQCDARGELVHAGAGHDQVGRGRVLAQRRGRRRASGRSGCERARGVARSCPEKVLHAGAAWH